MRLLDSDYLFSLLTGILFMTQIAWAVVFLLGRTLVERKEYEQHKATPLRWWTGGLAAALSIAFLFAFVVRSCLDSEWDFYYIYFDMLAIPVGAIVMVILVMPQPITRKRILANILPFVVCCTAGVIVQQRWFLIVVSILVAIYIIAMIIYVIVFGQRHEEEIRDKYSTLEGRSIRWMILIAPILLGFLMLNYALYATSMNPFAAIIYDIIAFAIWNYIYVHIYRMVVVQEGENENQNQNENENQNQNENENQNQNQNEDQNQNEEVNAMFMERLQRVCEEEELFTKSDLTRDELARQMHMGHTLLTQRLKEATGLTFYDYINGLRIAKATALLEEGKMDVGSIGQVVGYNYRSTFYRAFAAIHGCTPVEYQTRLS